MTASNISSRYSYTQNQIADIYAYMKRRYARDNFEYPTQ